MARVPAFTAWRVAAANPRSKLLAHAEARVRFRMRHSRRILAGPTIDGSWALVIMVVPRGIPGATIPVARFNRLAACVADEPEGSGRLMRAAGGVFTP